MKTRHDTRNMGLKTQSRLWNNPDVKVRTVDNVYVDIFNCMATSLFGEDSPKLDCLENLPTIIGLYEQMAINARISCDVSTYFASQQICCLLKKLELPLFLDEARRNALQKWLSVEAECKEMNRKCWDIFQHPLTHAHPELQSAIRLVSKEVYSLLGDLPPDLDEIAPFLKFGPGASLSHPHNKGAAIFKLSDHSAFSGMNREVNWLVENTGLFAESLISNGFCEDNFDLLSSKTPAVEYVDHAKLDFVPKSISEMRTIEIGPSLATLFQQAYDGFIRRRLLEWGIDLSRQEPNQCLAYEGSIRGEHPNSPCTIDLSAASDRISYGIVALLFPPAWVRTLAAYRAKFVRHDGEFFRLEKFSSMGNALTFSLQTLIFSAVVRSVLREHGWEGSKWRVYGDDIIVPYRIYDFVVRRLELFGFVINSQKSFSKGYFRESCGVDFLRGTNVRPLYIKKPLTTVAELFKVLNLIQLTAARAPIPAVAYEPLYRLVLGLVPIEFRLFGDTRFALDSCVWSPSVDGGVVLHRRTKYDRAPNKLAYLSALFTGYTGVVGSMLDPIEPHMLPSYPRGGSYVIRRSRIRGRVVRPIRREDLPFEPILV